MTMCKVQTSHHILITVLRFNYLKTDITQAHTLICHHCDWNCPAVHASESQVDSSVAEMTSVDAAGLLSKQVSKHTHTHTHTTVLQLFGFCPGQPGWASTSRNIHPLTLIMVINHPYLLPPSTTIHGILPIQSTCFTVFYHNLSPSFLWSTSWPGTLHSYSIHFFTQSLSSFRNTCPYHRNLFCCSTEIM